MAMSYIRIYYDWTEATRMLTHEEKGRLIDALVHYARDGEGGAMLSGNERYVFPTFQRQLDREARYYANVCRHNAKASRAGAFFKDKDKDQDKEKEKDEDKDKYEDQEPSVLKNIDDSWRTSARARGAVAQRLVETCISENLPCGAAKNLHDVILQALEAEVEPEEILNCCRDAGRSGLGRLLYEAMCRRGTAE